MTPDFLYELLPLFHRQRDLGQGQPLRALMGVLQSQFDALHDDIDNLYANWFIETCDPWVIPYLADLVAVRGLDHETHAFTGARRYVANTIAYRRAKGTVATLNSVIEDVTGWGVRVVEFFGIISATQSVKHPHRLGARTASLRRTAGAEVVEGPFNTDAHTVDVRAIAPQSIDPQGLLELQPGRFQAANIGIYCWRLQSYPVDSTVPGLAGAGRYAFHPFGIDSPLFNNPVTLTSDLAPRLEANLPVPLSAALLLDPDFPGDPPFQIACGGAPIPPDGIAFADLEHWSFPFADTQPTPAAAVDLRRGRFIFDPKRPPKDVTVSYCYGFPGDCGGGPYWRQTSDDDGYRFSDSLTHPSPAIRFTEAPQKLCVYAVRGARPCLEGDLVVTGATGHGCELTLDGLWIRGRVIVEGNATLIVRNCTIWPASGPSIETRDGGIWLGAEISRSVTGPIHWSSEGAGLSGRDSIIDGRGGPALRGAGGSGSGPCVSLERSTIFGPTHCSELTASTVLFDGQVNVLRRDSGYIRYSYVPAGSTVPKLFHCYPRHEGEEAVRPVFTSRRYGDPGYAQLSEYSPLEIRAGAEDGSELGVFHDLYDHERRRRLRQALDEFLPVGLQAGVFYVS